MQNEREKQNTIRNSKLQMSIKPFNVTRQDLSKSKSVDKARKGISRVNTTTAGLTSVSANPSSQNVYSSLTTQPPLVYHEYANLPQNPNHQSNLHEPNKNGMSQLKFKSELLERQLVVIQKENIELVRERNEWRTKCNELLQVNSCLQNKLNEMSKEQSMRQREQRLSKEEVYRLSQELKQAQGKIKQLQQGDWQRQQKNILQAEWCSKEFRLLKEQKMQLEETYRQLLIKSSSATNEIAVLESKLRSMGHQLSGEQEKNSKIVENYRVLEEQLAKLQEEAVFGRACRKQLEENDRIRQLNAELLSRNKEYEGRMKELEQKRLNQIQFHQQEMRRVCATETSKLEGLIEIYRKQRDDAQKEVQDLATLYSNAEYKQRTLIDSLNNEYESIVMELKEKLTTISIQKQHLQLRVRNKESEIAEVRESLRLAEQDNNLLLLKFKQEAEKNKATRGRQNFNQPAIPLYNSAKETVGSLHGEIKALQQCNEDNRRQISDYEVEFIKLSDKIHIFQVDVEKYKSREDTYQRKIKHLSDQIEHLEGAKSKEIAEKIKLLEEVQNVRLALKNKQIEYRGIDQKLCAYQEQLDEKTKNLDQLVAELQIKKQQLGLAQSNIQQLTSTFSSLTQELDKEKHSRKILEEEFNIIKEKIIAKHYRTQKQSMEAKEGRFSVYCQLFIILETEADINGLEEEEILSWLSKLVRGVIENKASLLMKVNKIQLQYREIVATEETTRALAQKYQQKCCQLESLLIRMQEAHKDKVALIKQDYDVVYGKYMKYRNMVVSHNKDRSREKDLRR